MSRFINGLDLGQVNDYTALVVVEQTEPTEGVFSYAIRHMERVRQISYPTVVANVNQILATDPLSGQSALVLDRTGVGVAVADLFADSPARPIIGVTITGGNSSNQDAKTPTLWNVPKKDLVAALQAAGGNGLLKYSPALPYAGILDAELLNFKRKFTTTNISYEAWREGEHDDVLLALSLAVWWGENQPPPPAGATIDREIVARPSYGIRRSFAESRR